MHPIHIASIRKKDYLFLRPCENTFTWCAVDRDFQTEERTSVGALSIAAAIQAGYKAWKANGFRLVHCGFRYTLPERDQVGSNALFWQMALSYNSSNGRYFDEEAGHFCFVDFASQEAKEIWKKIHKR